VKKAQWVRLVELAIPSPHGGLMNNDVTSQASPLQRTFIVILTLIGMPILAYIFLAAVFDYVRLLLRALIALILWLF
jgi:hypothetical protein